MTAEQSEKMEDEKMKKKWQLNKVKSWKMKDGNGVTPLKPEKMEDEKMEMESHL